AVAVIAAVEHVGGEPHAAAGGVAQEREEIACARFFLRTCDQAKSGPWPGLRRGGAGDGCGRRWRVSQERKRRKLPRRCLHHDKLEAIDGFGQIIAVEDAFAFFPAQVSAPEQAAEPSPPPPR